MSARLPVGSALAGGAVNAHKGADATDVSGGVECSIDPAQQAHVHRTQNAGQPLSGADSIAPIGHVSGTRSELTPLASAMSTASTAMKNARRMSANISVGARFETDRAAVYRLLIGRLSRERRPTDEPALSRTGCIG